ncbi:substrate-binding periplasmic protein [Pseudoalteromonas umbrosa]|uniref:substrate-binding periplasmic protein n=1 Tax=Pseudoalteromonas umbrosa TaxID=3048489 RepID=UPI0030155B1B
MMIRQFIGTCLLFLAFTSAANNVKETIYVAKEQRPLYDRDLFLYELLQQALQAAKYDVNIEHVKVHPHQQRTLMALNKGQVDLHWSMTSPAREKLAIAVKFPLFDGLIGKRVLVIHKSHYERFKRITELEQLSRFTAVQGHDWPDTKILSSNGLNVKPIVNYQAMFDMVLDKKADYFPRSIVEAQSELLSQNNPALMIVPDYYLSYPARFYFFVNKDKAELAQQLEKGLAKLKSNGSYEALLQRYFDLNMLTNSHMLPLTNPFH